MSKSFVFLPDSGARIFQTRLEPQEDTTSAPADVFGFASRANLTCNVSATNSYKTNGIPFFFHTCVHIWDFQLFFLPSSYLHRMWVTSYNRCEQSSVKLDMSSNVELIMKDRSLWEDTAVSVVFVCLSAVCAGACREVFTWLSGNRFAPAGAMCQVCLSIRMDA